MSINVNDLPPAYQAQALRKWAEQEQKKGRGNLSSVAANDRKMAGKYHNKSTERVTAAGNVLRFDSQKEARRYDELVALERTGEIRDLRMQVDFTLQEAYTDREGQRVRAIRYRADFTYAKWDGMRYRKVVEDVKSRATRTKTYIIKRKLMKERFEIDIREV